MQLDVENEQVELRYRIGPPPGGVREIRKEIAARNLTLACGEIRWLVDEYYQRQDERKATANQIRAGKQADEKPWPMAEEYEASRKLWEQHIEQTLSVRIENIPVCDWARSITGVGPIIAAALYAYIDIEKCPTVGHIWSFAGLNPNQHWLGRERAAREVRDLVAAGVALEDVPTAMAASIGCRPETILRLATSDRDGKPIKLTASSLSAAAAKRPWCARLKCVLWNLGECFVKTANRDGAFYGPIYQDRKLLEQQKNDAGEYKDQAARALAEKNFGKATEARKWYEKGLLPPAHIHARAKRYAVKLFLAHWHWVAYESRYGEPPPKPYVIEHLGHAHILAPPGWHPNTKKVP